MARIIWYLSAHPKGLLAQGAGGVDTREVSADVGDRIIERGNSFRGREWAELERLAKSPGYFEEGGA